MSDAFEALAKGLGVLVGRLGEVAAVLGAVGILAYAIIDFVKDTFNRRRWWQRKCFTVWVDDQIKVYEREKKYELLIEALAGGGIALDKGPILRSLYSFATAGDEKALYDQPLEKMAGLINAALQMAVERPQENRDLILVFAHRAEPTDLEAIFSRPTEREDLPALQARAQARARIAAHIQRSLDGVVASIGASWERLVRWAAIGVSTALILVAGWLSGASTVGGAAMWIPLGIVGGLLAPTINDFAKTIGALKKR